MAAAPLIGAAQTKTGKAHVEWGPDQTAKEHGYFSYVIDDVGNSTFLAVDKKKEFLIQRMDGLRTMWQKPVDLEWDGEDLAVERILLTNKEVLVFALVIHQTEELLVM